VQEISWCTNRRQLGHVGDDLRIGKDDGPDRVCFVAPVGGRRDSGDYGSAFLVAQGDAQIGAAGGSPGDEELRFARWSQIRF